LTNELKSEDVERLRAVLKPRRERYDFAYTMNRWASEVGTCDKDSNSPILEDDDGTDWDALAADMLELDPEAPKTEPRTKQVPRKRRPRADKERYAALLLAVIYREYAGEPPTRIVKPDKDWQTAREYSSRFYKFAQAAFELIDLEPRPQAFREAWERWKRSRDFSKDAMRALLWGGLPGFERRVKPRSKRKSPA
jgi:hypothetical protein